MLEKMKVVAAEDPERFASELAEGKLAPREKSGFIDFNYDEIDLGMTYTDQLPNDVHHF